MRLLCLMIVIGALGLVQCGGTSSGDSADRAATDGSGGGSTGSGGAPAGGSGGIPSGGNAGDGGIDPEGTAGAAGSPSVTRPPGPLVEYGFEIGLPQVHTLLCSYDGVTGVEQAVPDNDWLCTFDYATTRGHVYVQATPVSCTFRYSISTVFETHAWLSIDGLVTELTAASYHWGDYHHVDYLTFEHEALSFEYGHSSLGASYRTCYPMDCLIVRDAAGGNVVEDGCTSDRTLPVTCVPIRPAGTHAELVDRFVSCQDLEAHPEQWCAYAGGTLTTTFCCAGYEDYPSVCAPLSCTCTPENSREVPVCICPDGYCFDGSTCIHAGT